MEAILIPNCSLIDNSSNVFPAKLDSLAISNSAMCPSQGDKVLCLLFSFRVSLSLKLLIK